MPEELEVEGRDEKPVAAGHAPVRGELGCDERREVVGVRVGAGERGLPVVWLLLREVARGIGHAPVAQARDVVLAMEFAVQRVARVAVLRRPHLSGDARMSRDDRHARLPDEVRREQVRAARAHAARGHPVGVEAEPVARDPRARPGLDGRTLARAPFHASRQERGVDEEVRERVFLEIALEARLVGALRQPDAGRLDARATAGRDDAVRELRADGVGPAQEREVAVRRGAREDLDVSGAREVRERADEIALESAAELAQELRDVIGVLRRERLEGVLAELGEAAHILFGAMLLIFRVILEPFDDVRVRDLLEEHRREADRELERDARVTEVVQHRGEREISADDRFVQPLLAVRPAPRVARVREMAVQDEGEGVRHEGLRVAHPRQTCDGRAGRPSHGPRSAASRAHRRA